jgi:hypothetical protein
MIKPRHRVSFFIVLLLLLIGFFLFFGIDYRGNYPNISYGYFSYNFPKNPLKPYLTFRKNILMSYLFDWKEGVRPIKASSRTGFDLLNPKHSSAIAFRKQNNLDSLIATSSSSFEKIILLRNWTHEKIWPLTIHDSFRSKKYIPFSGFREGKSGFALMQGVKRNARMLCGEAAALFVQIAGVAGIPAREVFGFHHITAEAWSYKHQKWIVMDPLYNAHYEDNGTPLSFRELREKFYTKTGRRFDSRFGRKPSDYYPEVNEVINQSAGTSNAVFRIALDTIKSFYSQGGVELKGGPKNLPARIPSAQIVYFLTKDNFIADMSPSVYWDFGIGLRNDYLIIQYPIWHLRNHHHQWNYLHWPTGPKQIPKPGYQLSENIKDFYFSPGTP